MSNKWLVGSLFCLGMLIGSLVLAQNVFADYCGGNGVSTADTWACSGSNIENACCPGDWYCTNETSNDPACSSFSTWAQCEDQRPTSDHGCKLADGVTDGNEPNTPIVCIGCGWQWTGPSPTPVGGSGGGGCENTACGQSAAPACGGGCTAPSTCVNTGDGCCECRNQTSSTYWRFEVRVYYDQNHNGSFTGDPIVKGLPASCGNRMVIPNIQFHQSYSSGSRNSIHHTGCAFSNGEPITTTLFYGGQTGSVRMEPSIETVLGYYVRRITTDAPTNNDGGDCEINVANRSVRCGPYPGGSGRRYRVDYLIDRIPTPTPIPPTPTPTPAGTSTA